MTQHRLRITFSDLDEVIQTAPAPIRVSRDPRSIVAFARTSTSSSRTTRPRWGSEKSICGGRKSKPFLPNPDTGINVNTCSHVGRFTCVVRWKRCYRAAPRMGAQCLRRLAGSTSRRYQARRHIQPSFWQIGRSLRSRQRLNAQEFMPYCRIGTNGGGAKPSLSMYQPAGDSFRSRHSLGWSYVLEGSRLGARMILRTISRPGEHSARATHFLRDGDGAQLWQSYKAALSKIDGDPPAVSNACEGAKLAFHYFLSGAILNEE